MGKVVTDATQVATSAARKDDTVMEPRSGNLPPLATPAAWGQWADGEWHQLTPGVDHPQGRQAAVKAARRWAQRGGMVAEVRTPGGRGVPDAEPWSLRIVPRDTHQASALPADPAPRPLGHTLTVPAYLADHRIDVDSLTTEERAAEAYRLHCRAVDWATITTVLGYHAVAGAQRAAADHVATMGVPDRAVSTSAMIDQLDRALYRSLEVLDATHVKLYKGRIVMDAPDQDDPDRLVPLLDSAPTLAAASTIKGLLTTKAELLGLNAPTQHEHTLVPLPPTVAKWAESKRLDRPEVEA